jgi:hypothetical protein
VIASVNPKKTQKAFKTHPNTLHGFHVRASPEENLRFLCRVKAKIVRLARFSTELPRSGP